MALCDYCGREGCHWRRHPQARADVAAWQRELHSLTFPFGDYREDPE